MGDDHESHAAVGRHRVEKALEGIESARRCAEADDQARTVIRARLRRRPVFRAPRPFGIAVPPGLARILLRRHGATLSRHPPS
jgi:hypothetical protein